MITRLYCLRHGEPELVQTLLGSTDSPLSKKGKQQMLDNSEKLFAKNTLHQIYSSPLKRCQEFAKHCESELKLPLSFSENIRECNFGDWDGQTMKELYASHPDAVQDFWKDPWNHYPPNGEHPAEFSKRVINQVERWVREHQEQNLLLITHAGVIRTLIAWALDLNLESGAHFRRLELGYASLTLIDVYVSDTDGGFYPRLMYTNRVSSSAQV